MSLLTDIEEAITEAWINTPPVAPTAQREPNHVARLIGHVCQPVADSIVRNGIAKAASVRATFCHQNPYAFWQDPGDSGASGVVKRELGDLLIVVRSPLYSHALLLQTKMSGRNAPSPWKPGVVVPVDPTGQRDLYACLHPFYLAYSDCKNQPTADQARKAGSVAELKRMYAAQGTTLYPYKLAKVSGGAPPVTAPAMIFAWIDSTNANGVRTPQNGPWSAWLTESTQPVAGSKTATLCSTLSKCLEEMIRKPTPQAGRSIQTSGPDSEWCRLVEDLENWADAWFQSSVHNKTFDVQTVNGVYNSKLYNNKASAFMTWTTAGPYAELQKLPRSNVAWREFQPIAWSVANSRQRFFEPPSSPIEPNDGQPEGGFALIEIKLTSASG